MSLVNEILFSEDKERKGPCLTCMIARPVLVVLICSVFLLWEEINLAMYIYIHLHIYCLGSVTYLFQVATGIISCTVLCYLLGLRAAEVLG